MSALPPKADIGTQLWNVCFVPIADILHCGGKAVAFVPRKPTLGTLPVACARAASGQAVITNPAAVPLMRSRRRIVFAHSQACYSNQLNSRNERAQQAKPLTLHRSGE